MSVKNVLIDLWQNMQFALCDCECVRLYWKIVRLQTNLQNRFHARWSVCEQCHWFSISRAHWVLFYQNRITKLDPIIHAPKCCSFNIDQCHARHLAQIGLWMKWKLQSPCEREYTEQSQLAHLSVRVRVVYDNKLGSLVPVASVTSTRTVPFVCLLFLREKWVFSVRAIYI